MPGVQELRLFFTKMLMLQEFFTRLLPADLVQGVERKLRQNRSQGKLGALVATGGLLLQLVTDWASDKPYLENLPEYLQNFGGFLHVLFTGQWNMLGQYTLIPGLTGFLLASLGLLAYVYYAGKYYLRAASEEPFRYTIWIDPFKPVTAPDSNDAAAVQIHGEVAQFLHHDLMERLNERIKRLSLLDLQHLKAQQVITQEGLNQLDSHIHISGFFALRQEEGTEGMHPLVQITPKIRVGRMSNPETLVFPIKELLEADDPGHAKSYQQLVEKVYARVAAEIYAQIRLDLKEKLRLFPTHYLKAIALFYEAEDFARSNTVDAYEYAIQLYEEALYHFKVSLRAAVNRWMLRYIPWRTSFRFHLIYARTHTGHIKAIIQREIVSTLSGRKKKSIYGAPAVLLRVIDDLFMLQHRIAPGFKALNGQDSPKLLAFLHWPADNWLRLKVLRKTPRAWLEKLRQQIFEAHLVTSLVYYHLGALKRARSHLDLAKSTMPAQTDESPLYLMAQAELEPLPERKFPLLVKATELDSTSEIAFYLLASCSETLFRKQSHTNQIRVEAVVRNYEKVLALNPANISSITSLANLCWLVGKTREAAYFYRQGMEIKTVFHQTAIDELSYGKARLEAECGNAMESIALFQEVIANNPSVAVFDYGGAEKQTGTMYLYDFMNASLHGRYHQYLAKVSGHVVQGMGLGSKVKGTDPFQLFEACLPHLQNSSPRLKTQPGGLQPEAYRTLWGYAWNDYGNASFNLYLDNGQQDMFEETRKAYQHALACLPNHPAVLYNLAIVASWQYDTAQEVNYLERAMAQRKEWHSLRNRFLTAKATESAQQQKALATRLQDARKDLTKKLSEQQDGSWQPQGTKVPQTFPSEKAPLNKVQPVNNLPAKDIPPVAYPLQEEITALEKEIAQLENELAEGPAQQKDEINRVIRRVLQQTNFSPIAEFLWKMDKGNGDRQLFALLRQLQLDLVKAEEYELLAVLPLLLANVRDMRQEAIELVGLLKNHFSPEDYNLNRFLVEMHYASPPTEKALLSQPLEELLALCKFWVQTDNRSFQSHSLLASHARDYFDFHATPHSLLDDIQYHAADYGQEVLLEMGKTLLNIATPEVAAHCLYYAHGLDKSNNEVSFILAKAWMEDGHLQKAVPLLQQLHEAAPLQPDYFTWYYHALSLNGQQELGKSLLEALLETGKTAEMFFEAGSWFDQESYRYEAYQCFTKASDLLPGDEQYALTAGNVCYHQERFEEAIQLYKRAQQAAPKSYKYPYYIALTLIQQEAYEKAIPYLKKALKWQPGEAGLHNDLGNCYFRMGHYAEALACYEAAATANPGRAVYHANAALACNQLVPAEQEKALQHLQQALALEPRAHHYLNSLGNQYFHGGNFVQAAACYEQAIAIDPNFQYYLNWALSLSQVQNPVDLPRALGAFKQAILLNPNHAMAYNDLGNFHAIHYKDFHLALEAYEQALVREPDHAVFRVNKIWALVNLKQTRQAWDFLEGWARESAPGLVQQMGENLGQIQYFDMQGYCFSVLANTFPEEGEYQARAALAYFSAHDHTLAWYHFQASLAAGYQSIALMQHAAKAAYEDKEYGQAVTLLLKIIQMGGEQPDVLNLLGNAHFMLGQYQEALGYYQKACDEEPGNTAFVANWASTVETMQGAEIAMEQLESHLRRHGLLQRGVLDVLAENLTQNQSGLASQVKALE
jgi:tetratricopeptide (TPR) repeat protein